MAKPEWGTKRSCPKCGERFYDLGKDDPVTCIECGEEWHPEPVLKTKQPIPFEEADKKKEGEPIRIWAVTTSWKRSPKSTRTMIRPTMTSTLAEMTTLV